MLINKLHVALHEIAEERTLAELGDRSSYLGASEIGKCTRKVILGKLYQVKHSLKSLLLFERGHMTENIIYRAMVKAGIKPVRQYECRYDDLSTGMTLMAHIDFAIGIKNSLYIIESKSVGSAGIPDVPYPEHEEQLILQLNLAKLKHPTKILKGGILYVSMDGELELFSQGYAASDAVFRAQVNEAQNIWETYQMAMQVQDVVGYCNTLSTSPGPLCAFCDFSQGCPRMATKTFVEMRDFVYETYQLQQEIKKLQRKVDARKTQLKEFITGMELYQFETGEHNVRMVTQNRTKIDYKSLEQDMEEKGLSLDNYRTPYEVKFPEIKPITEWLAKAA